MKKYLTFSLFLILALALVFAMAPTIGAGPPDVKDSGVYALNQTLSDLTIFATATGGINGGPNLQILATATSMDEVPFLKNESYAILTVRPDPGTSQRANYIIADRIHKTPRNIASVIASRPGYPLRT